MTAAPVVAWAFAREGLTNDRVALLARTEAGHELGVLLVGMTLLLLAAGLIIGFTAANRTPTVRTRRRAGAALVAVLALVPVAGLVVMASKPGGIGGQISKGLDQLTDPGAATPSNQPGRLTATASVRSRYWREAIDIWRTEKLHGAGAAVVRGRPHPLPHGPARGAPSARLRRRDAGGPGARRPGALARAPRRLARGARPVPPACGARTGASRSTRSASACSRSPPSC